MVEQQVIILLNEIMQHITSSEQLAIVEKSLGCVDGKIIGTGRSDYTQGSTVYNLTVGNKPVALIDIPGIEGDESRFEEIIRAALDKAHIIFYVNGSGKKPEPATLEKVKKYMHDGTSVYAIFNVHCKAKKERVSGIDQTFDEELSAAYARQKEIIDQTESELRTFLGSNYKGSISLNGLLAFCGYAMGRSGKTTIADEEDKNLRSDQKKYVNEYSGNIAKLREDSHIGLIQNIIDNHIGNFEAYIYSENVKKLKNRLHEMINRIDDLKTVEIEKIRGFISIYDDFELNCRNAKEDCIHIFSQIGYNAASDGFADVKSDLFRMVEEKEGKIKDKEIQEYFDSHKDTIVINIQNAINNRMRQAQHDYEEAIEEARRRLIKDFEREQTKFKISLSSESIELDDSFADALKYNLKSFGSDLFRVGSLALSGAAVGSIIPGIGTIIGALAGAVLGALSCLWNHLVSKTTRINNTKKKLQQEIDDQIDKVSDNIKSEMKNLNYEEKINASYDQIYHQAEKQKSSLELVERILNRISRDLMRNYKSIS